MEIVKRHVFEPKEKRLNLAMFYCIEDDSRIYTCEILDGPIEVRKILHFFRFKILKDWHVIKIHVERGEHYQNIFFTFW